jgi:serine phosphatase RsbU (regulator of sigma subunit)
MGLTLYTFLSVVLMMVLTLRVRGGGTSAWVFRTASIMVIMYALATAGGYIYAGYQRGVATMLIRFGGAIAVVAYYFFIRMALVYPKAIRLIILDIAFALLTLAIGMTDIFVVDVRRIMLDFVIFESRYFPAMTIAGLASGLVAAAVTVVRAFRMRNRVFRQQLFLVSISLAMWAVWGFAFMRMSPLLGFGAVFPLSALNGLFVLAAFSYAFTSTRTFQVLALSKGLLAWTVMLLVFGVPAGLATGAVFMFRENSPATTLLGSLIVCMLLGRWAERFARGRLGIERSEAAREDLEAAIAHLDLSSGREAVLQELDRILGTAFGCSWFQALSEDDEGDLVRVHPDDETIITVAGSPLMSALASVDRSVILRTELEADVSLEALKASLAAFFDALGAEAVIVAREGRRLVGVFAFGPRQSGADYDALDYETFSAIHGKLFVVAYYARHVARESLLQTVEKEIGLADQVVRSVQQNIDPIVYPGAEVAFRCESLRGLGGDIFDSVRISTHRWFIVVGDVSGKGLNASMSMIILKSMIRTLLKEEKDFARLVARINRFIKERLPRGTFFSGLFAFLALDKGAMYFINCGIPAMYFRSPGLDSVMEAQGEGKMLGFVRDVEPYLKTRKLMLPPGSRVVISTDGILEAESVRGERYGKERLVRIISENKGTSPAGTVDAIVRSAGAFAGGRLDDDITVVTIDWNGRSSGEGEK